MKEMKTSKHSSSSVTSRLATASLALSVFLLASEPSTAFVRPNLLPTVTSASYSSSPSRSTNLHLFGFLNEGKKALVKNLAGEYDSVAIQERINGLIGSNDVLMLSFTT
jgi:hypothetical protein